MVIHKAGAEPLTGLGAFLEPFSELLRRKAGKHALERYTTGLLSDLIRKTAADIGRSLPGTDYQRLQEFLTNTAWDSREMDRLRMGQMVKHASVKGGVLIVDDTGFAKKGTHSVGVARQYSGTLGRVDNCQVVVTVHYVDRVFDWPVTSQLYLPERWATDSVRRAKARVPSEIDFQTKGKIALGLIDQGLEGGIEPMAVLSDAGYGDQPTFLNGLEERNLPYGVGLAVSEQFRLAEAVEADPGDPPPPQHQGKGRPRKPQALEDRVPKLEVRAILDELPSEAWSQIAWREGTKGALVKECARVRVYRTGQRGKHIASSGWIIGERPLPGRGGDRKQYLVWGLDELSLEELVGLFHVRWVIERFYQDAKGQLGLDDYEGRMWPGLHRHLALVMLAHCFLTLQQSYGAALVDKNPAATARGFPPTEAKKYRRA